MDIDFDNITDDTVMENDDDTDYSEIFEKDDDYVKEIIDSVKVATDKFKSNVTSYTELEDFLNTLSVEEQKKIRKYAKENSIYGNPILETMLILQYGAVIQSSSFNSFVELIEQKKKQAIKEIDTSFKEDADYKIAQFSSAIDRLIVKLDESTEEINSFTENKKNELNTHFEQKMIELDKKIQKTYDLEIIKLKEKVYTPINTAVRNIPKTLQKSTDTYLDKLVKSEIYKSSRKTILLSMLGSFLGGLLMFSIINFL